MSSIERPGPTTTTATTSTSITAPTPPPDLGSIDLRAGWEAALTEFQHQAMHLESRGAVRAAVTLYDAIRIARAGGLACEHRRIV